MKTTYPNKTQIYYRDLSLENAKNLSSSPDDYDFFIEDEQIDDYKNRLSFILNIKAKMGTGLLFMCNKSWLVRIGVRGKVESKRLCGDEKMKPNKYCTFI